jgi:hypothetical protein
MSAALSTDFVVSFSSIRLKEAISEDVKLGMTADFCTRGPTPDIGCQSNCDQPGSGASGGNVQSRVIGYYESWAHDRACTGMVRSHIQYRDTD